MSGNSHQRKVLEKAANQAVAKAIGRPQISNGHIPAPSREWLGRSSIEAYLFFILGGGYAALTAYGISVNFYAGFILSFAVAICAGHLLWRSIWTHNWSFLARLGGTGMIACGFIFLVNQGYLLTHISKDPQAGTLSALTNLSAAIADLKNQVAGLPPPSSSTTIVQVDVKRPLVEVAEPHDVTVPGGMTMLNADMVNDGDATAKTVMQSAGLFIAPAGRVHEDRIFAYLHKREHDDEAIPHGDLPPGKQYGRQVPIGGPALREDGTPVTDQDRMDLYAKKQILYSGLLIAYQNKSGKIYHTEQCVYIQDALHVENYCTGHNFSD